MKKEYQSPELDIIVCNNDDQDIVLASAGSIIGGDNDLPVFPLENDNYN